MVASPAVLARASITRAAPVVDVVQRRLAGAYVVDPWGLDREVHALAAGAARLRWTLTVSRGAHLPADGPALVVANQRLASLSHVAGLLQLGHEGGRAVRFVGIPDIEPAATVLRRLGGVLERPDEVAGLLRAGEVVVVWCSVLLRGARGSATCDPSCSNPRWRSAARSFRWPSMATASGGACASTSARRSHGADAGLAPLPPSTWPTTHERLSRSCSTRRAPTLALPLSGRRSLLALRAVRPDRPVRTVGSVRYMAFTRAADGTGLHFDALGLPGREPVLMIQGLGADKTGWVLQRFAMAPHFRTIALDNRGAGRSDKPFGLYHLDEMADDAVAVLDAAGVERAHVVGASMGGAIAQVLAVRHPERVRSLVLACTACRHHDWRRELLAEWAAIANERGMAELSRRAMRWLVGPRSLRRFWPASGRSGLWPCACRPTLRRPGGPSWRRTPRCASPSPCWRCRPW